MSQADTPNATRHAQPCGGPDNDHDGCGVTFPRMSPETLLCQLCKKLKKQGLTEDEVLRLKVLIAKTKTQLDSDQTFQETLKQCFQCGICGTHIGDPCGSCKRRGQQRPKSLLRMLVIHELTPILQHTKKMVHLTQKLQHCGLVDAT